MAIDETPVERAERLIAEGRAKDAAELLETLLAEGRGGLLLRVTLVSALIEAGDIDAAIATARETTRLDPVAAAAAISLGEALLAGEKLAAAVGEFQRALRLDPNSARARFGIGLAWLAAGEADKAIEAFGTISGEDRPPALAARIAEAQRMKMRPRSDPRYVRHLFDEFSESYDARMLGQLSYGAPAILRQLAEMVGVDPAQRHSILDLGCGTGLSGAAFADIACRLDGIDLSAAMVEKARQRRIYDSVIVTDIEEWANADSSRDSDDSDCSLHSVRERYDIVVAADTLVYLGDLSTLVRGVAQRLAPGGFFFFTVEKAANADFELGLKRRWRHSENYLRKLAEDAELDIAGLISCSPRTESGVQVEGFAVALKNAPCPAAHDND